MMMPRSTRPVGALAVQLERDGAHLGGQGLAQQPGGGTERDVLVVALLGLRRRREHRLRQALGLLQVRRQPGSVHRAAGAVLLPRRPGDVAADDALHREHLRFGGQHDPPRQIGLCRRLLHRGRQVVERRGDEVAGHHAGQLAEPEGRHGGQDPALVRDRLGHDDVERRDAIARHHQQSVIADGVDVANLAGVDVGQAECWSTGHGRASQRCDGLLAARRADQRIGSGR